MSDDWLAAFASPRINWGTLQAFRAVAMTGSFRKAAAYLGMSLNTARSHVDIVEYYADRTLFRRSVAGMALTDDGKTLFVRVEAMAATLEGRAVS